MSIPQTNFENNNRMSELTKNINDIFGHILLYTVIIFTTLSALLGGIVVYPIYGLIYIFNKIRENCCTSAAAEAEAAAAEAEVKPVKKPIIDENWCNVSVKNIINFADEVENEAEENEAEENEAENEAVVNEEVANEAVVNEEVASESVVNLAVASEAVEEILSVRRPSEEELRKKEEEEADDYSPKDKYSIGHYKSNTCISDPLDFDN